MKAPASPIGAASWTGHSSALSACALVKRNTDLTIETRDLSSNEGIAWITHVSFIENSQFTISPARHKTFSGEFMVECEQR